MLLECTHLFVIAIGVVMVDGRRDECECACEHENEYYTTIEVMNN